MSYLLVIFDENWADEFDCEGFKVIKKDLWMEHLQEIKFHFDEDGSKLKCGFGTNEWLEFESFDQYKKAFKTKELTDEQAKDICELFDLDIESSYETFGIFAWREELFADHDNDFLKKYIKKYGKPSWLDEDCCDNCFVDKKYCKCNRILKRLG